MLATDSPHELRWDHGSLLLQVPRDNERLIGTTSMGIDVVAPMFPGCRLIPVHLELRDLTTAPPVVWETLDAIVLNHSEISQLSKRQISAILAGDVTIPAIILEKRPPNALDFLHRPKLGSANELIDENAYAPTFAWTAGWSTTVRWQVMGAAAVFMLVMMALLLLPSRLAIAGALVVTFIAAGGVACWRSSLGNIDRIGGDVIVNDVILFQQDAWVYERAKESSPQTVRWNGWMHPIFSSAAALRESKMRLNLTPTGETEFVYDAIQGHTMAFVRRDVRPGEMLAVAPDHQSPMQDVAKTDYLENGDRITGEIPGAEGRWGAVVIEHKQ